jgi:NAD(P)-dependent dehydrogenase (short-subunit alcohol dehydrogenase family)
MLFNGEVAIVTGGAQGIGKATAKEFCLEGAKVAIFDINDEKGKAAESEIQKSGGDITYVHCDVSNLAEIDKALEQVSNKYHKINILVNNAAILHSTPIEKITENEWNRILAVNLNGVFFMTQKVLPSFIAQKGGKIVNMASIAGRMGGILNGLGYTATKAAIIGLTYGFARRLAVSNINVNAVSPGPTDTTILDSFTAEQKESLRQSIPLKRIGTPQDIANAIVFLASSKADFITGAVLDTNGGIFMG